MRIAKSLDFCPGSSVSSVPGLLGPREPYCVVRNPLCSAESRYLPGAIPEMANRPAASVVPDWVTWTFVTPGRGVDPAQGDQRSPYRFAGGRIGYLAADGARIVGTGLRRQRQRQQ